MKSYHKRLSVIVLMYLLFTLTFSAMTAKLLTPLIFLLLNSPLRRLLNKVKSLAIFFPFFHAWQYLHTCEGKVSIGVYPFDVYL